MHKIFFEKVKSRIEAELSDERAPIDLKELYVAVRYANEVHRNELRLLGGLPYLVHILGTLIIALGFREILNKDELVSIALHDAAEKNIATFNIIKEKHGNYSYSIIYALSKMRFLKYSESYEDYCLSLSYIAGPHILCCKMIDILDNSSSLHLLKNEPAFYEKNKKKYMFAAETFSNSINMYSNEMWIKMKNELYKKIKENLERD
jgi:(p)ppGpp synthase/HD superfamily hydrolase